MYQILDLHKNTDNVITCLYNPKIKIDNNTYSGIKLESLDECIKDCNYIIITCSLNKSTRNLVNKELILKAKKGVKIINVSKRSCSK